MDIQRYLSYAAMAAALILAAACGKDEPDPDKGVSYEFITLLVDGTETRSDSLWFTTGTSGTLSIEQMKDARWSISDQSVASITADGMLTAIKPGQADITARNGSKTIHYGLVIPDFSGNHFDIKGADFSMDDFLRADMEPMCLSKSPVRAYVWNAVLTMEDHFYSSDYWNFTKDWDPKVTMETVKEFITRLNGLTRMSFRLPTAAEWTALQKAGLSKAKAYTSDGADDAEEIWIIKD